LFFFGKFVGLPKDDDVTFKGQEKYQCNIVDASCGLFEILYHRIALALLIAGRYTLGSKLFVLG